MKDADSIFEALEKTPEDWNVRILAIEEMIQRGDVFGARKLVREDPSGSATPPEIQVRLHELLTKGAAALAEKPEPGPEEAPPSTPEPPEPPEPREEPVAEESDAPEKVESKKPSPFEESYGGGLGALMEGEPEAKPLPSAPPLPDAPEIRFEKAIARWREYDGNLNLVPNENAVLPDRISTAPDRVSSISLALLAHALIFFLIGLVAVNMPRPKPPQLVVSVVHERQTELITPRITKPNLEIKPAAAAAQAVDVIASIEGSTFEIPDVDNSENTFVSSILPGVQPKGIGMDFFTEATQASDVNFFGISGSGRKIVFVIDATPFMLVDEKGGMTAYNNVKDEVGVMLANLNRATHFNILLYHGRKVIPFRKEPVPGLPSNLRQAIEWLTPLNRDYEKLGLTNEWGYSLDVADHEDLPLRSVDLAHYTKAIQKAAEWQASAVFCIVSGYGNMTRSLTPEMKKKMEENPPTPGTPGTIDPQEKKAWDKAVAETRAWLTKENAARQEKGIDPKVVTNFNQLVVDRTGVRPPRRRGGTPGSGNPPRMPGIGPEDVEDQIEELVKLHYKEPGLDEPSVHMVLFLGEDERIQSEEDHFRRLTRKNRGKLKVLRGLSALQDVTGQ
ncbi:MAG: hypothetical protein P1U87_01355 [Verrucomicrobiales bacterium]|nr:hypothetical protein [Verrucomicrobiales bacterium]